MSMKGSLLAEKGVRPIEFGRRVSTKRAAFLIERVVLPYRAIATASRASESSKDAWWAFEGRRSGTAARIVLPLPSRPVEGEGCAVLAWHSRFDGMRMFLMKAMRTGCLMHSMTGTRHAIATVTDMHMVDGIENGRRRMYIDDHAEHRHGNEYRGNLPERCPKASVIHGPKIPRNFLTVW